MMVLLLLRVFPPWPPFCGKPGSTHPLLDIETDLPVPSLLLRTTDAAQFCLLGLVVRTLEEHVGGSLWERFSNKRHALQCHKHCMHGQVQEPLAHFDGTHSRAAHELQNALRRTTRDDTEPLALV
mmetsp:Transcript_10439/g.63825  ORF Transcript_10439/g.63825 Transcript_10439/m.63825 type:complete len:125 (+) Transcript_10439:1920-2294(+)